ncbi:helicase [Rathayibacter rathayi]|uniref:Helicase n=3 Tax=Rathayibacter rathayi TaxID=33887 RepID=A0ABX5A942_RATRA|nr:SNF2-related protein [Rathayibacter rathayi]PPH19550.1 helicase [Rathayibacter rathayi]PPH35217.1 helicase [Rathayibacter rathayi]PPH74225.1 helicase [Rathayibacter rathayi]PPH98308.1 helicase [Rathayibacter rathayi]PPI06999.1 helicase [Rathayibacter rathayi]
MFDERNNEWVTERARLRTVLDDAEWAAARLTTINAHYTDPEIATAMWAALQRLGFDSGAVLEPGSGSGTFIGVAPAGATMTGIELDPLTASIAQHLYPASMIRAESFADTRMPAGSFDAAIGNVPFSDVALLDPRFNRGRHTMHNHFIIKSLELTRPGGVAAFLTSSFTMDAQNPAARREMNNLADLVGAVRLPSGALRRSAGTEVVTDLLIFRRRLAGESRQDETWEQVTARRSGEHLYKVNAYYDRFPEHVLGNVEIGAGIYGSATMRVVAELQLTPQRLRAALDVVVAGGIDRGLTMTTAPEELIERRAARLAADSRTLEGSLVVETDGTFTQVTDGDRVPFTVPKAHAKELTALLELRDLTVAQLTAEAASLDDTVEIVEGRPGLLAAFNRYQNRFGPVNRYNERSTGRTDKDTGEEIRARVVPTAIRLLREDPMGAAVRALELFDEETQTAHPSAILTERVVAPRPEVLGVDTPADAIGVSLDRTGTVDLDLVSDLLGVSVPDARIALGALVFEDPGTGALIHAPEYLSGDVRAKRDVVAALVDERPKLQGNLDALNAVMPVDVPIEDIRPRIGAVWISAEEHQAFLNDVLEQRYVRVANPMPATWRVTGSYMNIQNVGDWGTRRKPGTDIAEALMNQRPVIVEDYVDNHNGGKTAVVNDVETQAAQEKAEAMQERFEAWVWEDPDRASRLSAEYNRRFNSIVLRDYTTAGEHLTFPGMAASIELQPHQRAAVARMLAEPATGMFHEVGAGKTYASIAGVMKMKQTGLVRKPCVIVPNHMLDQFTSEWLHAYPHAKLLAASTDDLPHDKRRLFVARITTGDWDAVVMTQNAFKLIRVTPETQAAYIDRELSMLREALDAANENGEDARSVKQIERAILRAEERHKEALNKPHDPGVSFEQTGIDYLVVDELHMYKNLTTVSNISDAAIPGSQMAKDLHMKLEYLRGEHGPRVITGLTATPLANSIAEAHVMTRYIRPDLLENAGVLAFDAWAATFGQLVTKPELAPTANGTYRMHTRFARFQNVPEMLRLWRVFADVKTGEDLNLPRPAIRARADGQRLPEVVVIPPTDEMVAFMDRISELAQQIKGRPGKGEENMLTLVGRARRAETDLRLLGHPQAKGWGKLDEVASRILAEWQSTRSLDYRDPTTGEPSPLRGGMQLVFMDLGTPTGNGWNAYAGLKQLLIAGGIPAYEIRFIHDAPKTRDKKALFAAARAGHVAVLLGSTATMGVGTNVQTRITAMHHVDAPWRPADVEQRDGRGVRQGNQNAEVAIFRYVVEKSFGGYIWQGVARKAGFIGQIMRGRLDVREIEDIGPMEIGATQMSAVGSGNPLALEYAEAKADVARLRRSETAFHRGEQMLASDRRTANVTIRQEIERLGDLRTALSRRQDTRGDAFTIELRGDHFNRRPDAAAAIAAWAHRHQIAAMYTGGAGRDLGALGNLGGFDLTARAHTAFDEHWVAVRVHGIPDLVVDVPAHSLVDSPNALITKLENALARLESRIADTELTIENAQRAIRDIDARAGATFKYAPDLAAARNRITEIEQRMASSAHYAPSSEATPPPAAVGAKTSEPSRLTRPLRQHESALGPPLTAALRDQGLDRSEYDTAPAPGKRPQQERQC